MDLWEAIRSGSLENLKTTMKRPSSRQELMAQNAKNSAGLLMLAAEIGETSMLEYLADTIKKRLGMPQLAKQLRFEDAYKEPLMFYAAKSSPTMFEAVQKLVRDTIGEVGLTEQLRHRSARGIDILMKSCNDPITFEKVWDVLDQADCLEELRRDGKDKDGKSWIHHAAEAGNSAAFSRFDDDLSSLLKEFSSEDSKGWSGFMYAARGRRESNESFLKELCGYAKPADDLDIESQLKEQLTRVARDSDKSTLLMHAAIGGQKQFDTVRSLMCDTGCDVWNGKHDITAAMLLSWASKGGDIDVFERVAQGIKTGRFPDANNPGESWYICSAAENLADAIKQCAKEKGRSLFLSAVESDNEEMINSVGEGIVHIFKDPKECWTMLCGTGGNPVSLAAGKSVKSFEATLKFLQDKAKGLDQRGELKPGIMELLVSDVSPVCNAAISEDPDLFDKVWRRTNEILSQTPHNGSKDGSMILRHLDHLMMPDDQPGSVREKQISAKMLGRVLKAAKEADKNSGRFHTNTLDSFMTGAVSRGAFGHISELLKVGYDLEAHFPSVLDRIGKDEINTSQCMILAITTASNPFREYAIATKAIYDAMEKRSRDYAALDRLQQKIGDLKLDVPVQRVLIPKKKWTGKQPPPCPGVAPTSSPSTIGLLFLLSAKLLYHLPHSVGGFGEELSRGNPDFDPFDREPIGSVEPKRTLGFVLVRWILEDRAHSSHIGDSESGLLEGENSLVQAARSGPRALDFFSESLVVDYLRLNFSRTLPDWDTQKPFKHNINQAFYSYTQYARKRWKKIGIAVLSKQRTVLPGLQFILAGIIGKPVSYYIVPMIRMVFVVINFIATIGLYISCVSLRSPDIPWNEWTFYVVILGVVWREALEYSNLQKVESGIGPSTKRYFGDKWNFLDVITIGVVFLAFIFRTVELFEESDTNLFLAQFFLAAAAPFLFSRVLFFSQIGGSLGPMTQVIFNMVTKLSQFSLILLLVMLGFATTFNALYTKDTTLVTKNSDDCDVNDHPVVEAFGTIGDSLLTMFMSMLGDFNLRVFFDRYESSDGQDCGGVVYQEAGVTLMVIYLVIMLITLLNFLIAVLSTAHSEVQENVEKEFQLAKARTILKSAEEVKCDVLPPPFNLVKLVLGIMWPVQASRSKWWDHRWEVMTGTLHRMIFAFVVGLVALVVFIILWIVSIPLQTLQLSHWLSEKATSTANNEDGQTREEGSEETRPQSMENTVGFTVRSPSISAEEIDSGLIFGFSHRDDEKDKDDDQDSLSSTSQRFLGQPPVPQDKTANSEKERIFFESSDDGQRELSRSLVRSALGQLVCFPFALLIATSMCLFVHPLLSIILWMRGFVNVWEYSRAISRTEDRWERRQIDRGEEKEWSVARDYAIKINKRFKAASSSNNEFNVNALLKTTTGMTMEDLRQRMLNEEVPEQELNSVCTVSSSHPERARSNDSEPWWDVQYSMKTSP